MNQTLHTLALPSKAGLVHPEIQHSAGPWHLLTKADRLAKPGHADGEFWSRS
jgi:hypothetical protein